jgi:hypothetical protein
MSLFVFNEVILCIFAADEKLGGTTSLSINLVPSIMKGRGFLFFYPPEKFKGVNTNV